MVIVLLVLVFNLYPQEILYKKLYKIQNRFNRIRYGPIELNPEEKFLNRRLSERQREISQIPKGIIKSRKIDAGFILPDTPPTTPNRDEFPPPLSFTPPSVGPSDTNFITPQIPKPRITPLIDRYARPITKIIDEKKKYNKYHSKKT